MRFTISHAVLIAGFFLPAGAVFAQYQGPKSTDKFYTVKEIRVNAAQLDRIDALVRVRGYIVNQTNEDTYQFKDATGIILADIDRRLLPNRPFTDKTEIILIGEVDYDLLEGTEINVEQLLFVD